MSDLKIKATDSDVHAFLNSVVDEQKRIDAFTVLQLMESIVGEPAKMRGAAILGLGDYHYKGASGREGDWFFTAKKCADTLPHGRFQPAC